MGKVHGSLARAGKVRGQTPKVAKQDKKKNPEAVRTNACSTIADLSQRLLALARSVDLTHQRSRLTLKFLVM